MAPPSRAIASFSATSSLEKWTKATRDAISSYYVFRQMKKDGVIPSHVRFQVCMPLTNSAVASFFT